MKVKKHFVVAPVRNGEQTVSDNKLCLIREIRLPRNQQRKRKALTHLMTTLVHEARFLRFRKRESSMLRLAISFFLLTNRLAISFE